MPTLAVDHERVGLRPSDPMMPAAGEAILRPTRCLVTGATLPACQRDSGFTGVPGTEFTAVVESVAAGAPTTMVGQRVVVHPVVSCGDCDLCLAGIREQCRQRKIIGLSGLDGALASQVSVPVESLVRVPDQVDDEHAVFAVRVAAAIQIARQVPVESCPLITVLGDGSLGLITAQVLARLNPKVRLIGQLTEKLGLCAKWGIKHRHADDIGRRSDQDLVIDCTGTIDGLELALRLVRPRGRVVLKSLLPQEDAVGRGGGPDLEPLVLNEINLIGSLFGPLPEGMKMLARGEVEILNLVSRRMRLDDGPSIFVEAAAPEAIAVLVQI